MFNKISLFLLFILIPVMLLNGCIEHTFNLTVLPDEGVDVVYSARGDVMDFNDEGQLMPDSTVWDFNMWIEEQEDETIQNVKASLRIENLADLDRHLDWRRSKTDTLNLRHRFTVEKTTNPLGVDWVFTGVVFSRGFNLSYGDIWDYVPAECRALDDAKGMQEMKSEDIEILEERFALGVIQWNIHRFTERFDRVWNLSATHLPGLRDTSETTLSIAKAGWVEDLHQYLNKMDLNEPTLVNLDWWSDLRPLFLGHLIDIT
ncbi:MAG TPA: hypothetical protein ENL08_02015, partial [Bacteroidetes bacterium]|nr:hypothetical protein [Bacteroidota bacterium]